VKESGQSLNELIESGEINDFDNINPEEFDISGKIDINNPIYKFYNKDIRNYVKNKYGATEITDNKGVSWLEVKVKPEMSEAPVEAFQRETREKYKEIGFEEGRKILEGYKKRLNLDFNVDFADVIFTGEIFESGQRVKARGVTYNNTITLTDNLTKTTADHELVHLVVDNLEKIDLFKDISRENLLKAQNKGREVNYSDRAEVERLNEELAIGFEKKVRGESQSNVPMIVRRFYEKLQILLTDFLKAFNIQQRDAIGDLYRRLASNGMNKTRTTLTPDKTRESLAKFNRKGKTGLDFSFQNMREMDDIKPATSFDRHGTEDMGALKKIMPEYYNLINNIQPKGIESVYKNMIDFMGIESEEGKGEYEKITFKDQAAKALLIVKENPELATDIAMDRKKAPEGVLETAISIAVQAKALQDRNWTLFKEVAEVRSSKQTERGQEIVLERLRNIEEGAFTKIYSDFQELQNKLVKDRFYKNWLFKSDKANAESIKKNIQKVMTKEKLVLDKKLERKTIAKEVAGGLDSFLNALAC